ncbi:ABC transporter ATP-binding protein [Halobacterium sp. CBA1126]|nr:ABC transporter ATP-binding protein [Halobacterium sp. CBA1126]MUV60068.1 ABC transporter ATP-binding protein [Halobacterium sp. CBA1126]
MTPGRFVPARKTLLYAALVLNGELAAVLFYFAVSSSVPTDPVVLAYPFVWINAAIWAVWRVDLPSASRRQYALAAGVAVAYFLLLGRFGGLYMFHGADLGARISWLSPGWGPAFVYSGTALTVSLLPFKVVGYATLSYLVAATVLDAAKTGVAGLLGLFACVSCTWPVAATVFTGAFGSASALAAAAQSEPYALSTAVFVSSVLLLVWRPTR